MNLPKYELYDVIRGCKTNTYKTCSSIGIETKCRLKAIKMRDIMNSLVDDGKIKGWIIDKKCWKDLRDDSDSNHGLCNLYYYFVTS